MSPHPTPLLTWITPGDPFPPTTQAWGPESPAPGLLAAGGALDALTLQHAYRQAIFPWFSAGQPVLWWSPDPRMVLQTADFRLHASLRKTLQKFIRNPKAEIRIDTAFAQVIRACAHAPRSGQSGTWIVADMQAAYIDLHAAGLAHSVETWLDGELVGGLYCVALGRAVFGESMFTRQPDASKIALAALVALCRCNHIQMIDCQQNTRHLASLGAKEIPRAQFAAYVARSQSQPAAAWTFAPVYWNAVLPHPASPS